MVYGITAAMPYNGFLRAVKSAALDLYANRNGDRDSARRGDFVFIVNPMGANGRTGKEWKQLLPYLRKRLDGECNRFNQKRHKTMIPGEALMDAKIAGQVFIQLVQDEVCESLTSGPSHAIDITREAIREGADAVIAVGGDGTLNEVVNGFFWAGKPAIVDNRAAHTTALGIIPLGTGSDFARTFGWKNDPYEAIERIAKGTKSKIDVGVTCGVGREPHYFINVADIHLSAKAGYYASGYKRLGNLCYIIGALKAFIGHSNQDLKIKVDEGEWEILPKVTALCIGNAKFFGGGMKITPTADPSDGSCEVVILQNFKWYDFILNLHKLYRGTHLAVRNVSSRRVRSIEVEEVVDSGHIYVECDGEHIGFLPRKFCILPGSIDMLV